MPADAGLKVVLVREVEELQLLDVRGMAILTKLMGLT